MVHADGRAPHAHASRTCGVCVSETGGGAEADLAVGGGGGALVRGLALEPGDVVHRVAVRLLNDGSV
eukprot:6198304-Pleurochrysis_carterae.AAC.2